MASLEDFRKQHPEYSGRSDAELADALYKKFYASKMKREDFDKSIGFAPESGGILSEAQDIAHNLATGAVKGGAALLSLPTTADELIGRGVNWAANQFRDTPKPYHEHRLPGPTYEGITELAFSVMPEYQPKTTEGEYAQTAAEWATGALPMGPMGALAGGLGGLAAEGAGQLSEDNPYYKAAAGILAQVLATMLTRRINPTTADMVAQRTREMGPQQWNEAQQLADQARRVGTPLMGPEAVDSAPLQSLAGRVAASPQGGRMTQMMQGRAWQSPQQPGNVEPVVQQRLDQMAPAQTPLEATQAAKTGATQVIRNAEQARTQAARPFYDAANIDTVAQQEVQRIINRVDQALSMVAQGTDAARNLQAFRTALMDGQGNPQVMVGVLDSARKSWRDKIELPLTAAAAADKETAARLGPILTDLRDTMTRASGDFAYGRMTHEAMSPQIEAMTGNAERGILPNEIGQAAEAQTFPSMVDILTNPTKVRPDTIHNLGAQLRTTNPQALPGLARTWIENELSTAFGKNMGGPNVRGPVKFSKAIYGNQTQVANLQAILQETALAQGLPRNALWDGWNSMLEVFDRMGRIPVAGSPTPEGLRAAAQASRGPGVAIVEAANIGNPGGWIGSRLKEWYNQRNFSELADIFTRPDSVERLRELAKYHPASRRARLIAAGLLGANVSGK